MNSKDMPAENTSSIKQHEYFMRACIALARIAAQRGESPVGCVIVHGEKIIGEGIEGSRARQDITYHAEIEAIRHAIAFLGTQDLSGCSLYSTHEPCIMCSYVIRHTKIDTVVTGISTGDTGGYSSHLPLLTDATFKKWTAAPVIIARVLEQECRALQGPEKPGL